MLLERLCDATYGYSLMHSVEPSAAGDGLLYGQGNASFTGRVAGEAQWSDSPRLRGNYAFPNAHGVIILIDGGGCVLFTVTGMSSLLDGRGVHVLMFQTDDPAHAWLNEVMAVGEGSIDITRGLLAMRYYQCLVNDPPAISS